MPNDFLSNVSARASHATEAETTARAGGLRPRQAALFEPGSAALLPSPESAESGQVVESATQPQSGPPLAQAARQDAAEKQPVRAAPQEQTPRQTPARPGLPPDQAPQSNSRQPQPSAPIIIERMRERHFTEMVPSAPSPKISQSLPAPELRRENENNPQTALVPALTSAPSHSHAPTHDFDRRQAAPLTPAPAAASEPRASTRVTPEQIVIIRRELRVPQNEAQRLVPALVPDRKPQSSPLPNHQPQPDTINVTIGRIEVKASLPASLPKRAASAPTSMSLDEYLRHRQGGNR